MKRPAYQHYPSDWHNDAQLQNCSLGARGLWIEMLGLMHQGCPYGYLTIQQKDGAKDIHEGYLARWTGVSVEDVKAALSELEENGVFSRTESGTIYSRRMVRDEEVRQARANGGFSSQNNPNVPRKKDTQEGYPSRIPTKDVLSVEDEDRSRNSNSSFNSSEAARFGMQVWNLSGRNHHDLIREVIDHIKDKTPEQAIEWLVQERQAYEASPVEFKKGVKNWLSDGDWSNWRTKGNGKQNDGNSFHEENMQQLKRVQELRRARRMAAEANGGGQGDVPGTGEETE